MSFDEKRVLVTLAFVAPFLMLGCSSGLDGSSSKNPGNAIEGSTNLRFGFDPGMPLTDPITEFDVAGGVLPALTSGEDDRPVAFFAFVTEARADDGDGLANPLDRSAPAPVDTPGTADVFLAAVATDVIDPRAFVYSLAGKMMHPRCVTCHTMNVDPANPGLAGPATAFTSSQNGHPGGNPPFGTTSDSNCAECHFSSWRSPAPSFDLRRNSAAQLFGRAQMVLNEPTGQEEHFVTDPRVLWALGDGRLPFDNVADDDHDGIREPEDTDGVIRTVPGGVEDFMDRLEDWKASGQKFDSKEALADVVLVSRAFGLPSPGSAGNADSFSPSAVYTPNPGYMAGVSDPDTVPVGFVVVAYASDATDFIDGNTNGFSDVFSDLVRVFQRSDGSLDLVYDTTGQRLVSEGPGGQATNASFAPDIGGANGLLVAFTSLATDLVPGFPNANGDEPDVYLRSLAGGSVELVSHVAGNPVGGGNGASDEPDVSDSADVVAFTSAASDLVAGDANADRDVFWAALPLLDVQRASVASDGSEGLGGDCGHPSLFVFPGTSDVRIAFESTKTNLVPGTSVRASRNVYLRDSRLGGTTVLLNQIVGPGDTSSAGGSDADAAGPVISPAGDAVLFETTSAELDFVRPGDDNRVMDVMLADLALLEQDGFVLPYTLSVAADGGPANGASHSPRFASFRPLTDEFPLGLAVFSTAATNLSNPDIVGDADLDGLPDSENLVLLFLNEGARVLSNFEASPEKQGMGLEVRFRSRSSGDPTEFLWDFGDGSTSTEASPAHVYALPGEYTVSLAVSGPLGQDDRTRDNFVRVLGPVLSMFASTKDATPSGVAQDPADGVPNAQTIRGAIDPDLVDSSLTFGFDSTPSTECPDTFDWTLAEIDELSGEPIAPPVSFSSEASAETSLTARGMYEVTLQATGPGGAGGEATQAVEVWHRVEAAFSASTPVTGDAPLSVTFVDETEGDLESLSWRDGGVAFSTQLGSTMETFAEGVHEISLVARGLGGDQSTSGVLTVTSFGELTASFSPSNVEVATSSTFVQAFTNNTNETEGIPLSYQWDFDNGNMPTVRTPAAQSFPASASNVSTYDITLVASTEPTAPGSCSGQSPTQCSEATPGRVRLFPLLTGVSLNVSVSDTNVPDELTFTPSAQGIGTGTSPSFSYFRNAANGTTPNILLGTSFTTAPRTFTIATPGDYLFRVTVQTNGANGGFQTVNSTNVARTVFASFVDDVFPIMSSSCLSCHTSAANCGLNGNLSYGASPSALTVYNRLRNMAADHCGNQSQCPTPALLLINAGSTNPSNSWVFRKITDAQGNCGTAMPPGSSGLSAAEAAIFASFIQGGAPFGQ